MWPTMNRLFSQDDTPSTAEGTAAHWTGWEVLAGRVPPENTAAPNGVIVTEEMLEGAELLIDAIHRRMGNGPVQIETPLAIPAIHPECFGTPDAWLATSNLNIEIVDYKFGHKFVDEFFNPQGICYLLGILAKLGIDWRTQTDITCSFTIVQPRCFYKSEPVRNHTFNLVEALPVICKLILASDEAYFPSPVANTNSHCCYCPGRHACCALQRAAYNDAEFADDRQPVQIDATAAALELRMLERSLERLQARVEGLRELTLSNIKRGENVPFYRIDQGKGRAKWNVPLEQISALGSLYGVELTKETLITPSQAKKLIDESVIKAYSFIPATEVRLVAENQSDARRVFGPTKEK